MSDLKKWSLLKDLNPEFVSYIKFITVFGGNGDEVLIVTNDSKVYAIGSNTNGLIGFGHKNEIKEPSIVDELSFKDIIKFKTGNDFAIGLSISGNCYSWGYNRFGQLGNGSDVNTNKPKLIQTLKDYKIIDLSCGNSHSVVLTNKYEVMGFGNNGLGQTGCGVDSNFLIPNVLNGFNGEKVVQISCGYNHSMALTETGLVFGWGQNSCGQLGLNHNINQFNPQLINMNGVIVKDIACGLSHTLLLSIDGVVYGFGSNNFGQIGCGNRINSNFPIKINLEFKCIAISAHFSSNISIAKAFNGICYVWGETNYKILELPENTNYYSIHDVIADYSQSRVTHKCITYYEILANYELITYNLFAKQENCYLEQFRRNCFQKLVNEYTKCNFEELRKKFVKKGKIVITIKNIYRYYLTSLKFEFESLEKDCIDFVNENLVQMKNTANYIKMNTIIIKNMNRITPYNHVIEYHSNKF